MITTLTQIILKALAIVCLVIAGRRAKHYYAEEIRMGRKLTALPALRMYLAVIMLLWLTIILGDVMYLVNKF